MGAPQPAAWEGERNPGGGGAGSARRRLPGRSCPCAARSGRSRSLVFPPRSPAPRCSGIPEARRGGGGDGAPSRGLPSSLVGELGGRGMLRGRGLRAPRRRSCQRREVSQVAGGGDAVPGGGRRTSRRIPGVKAQIKGRGRSQLLRKDPLPTSQAPGPERVGGPGLLERPPQRPPLPL